jgi:hypothetical protein
MLDNDFLTDSDWWEISLPVGYRGGELGSTVRATSHQLTTRDDDGSSPPL